MGISRVLDDATKAIVNLPRLQGRGILVGGNLVLTAAHCIDYKSDGSMVLGDYFIEEIETAQGERLKASPVAVEPVQDIAVLGSLDGQEFYKEAERFETFCENTRPLTVCQGDVEIFQKFPVYVYNLDRTWVPGRAQKCNEAATSLFLEPIREIRSGASGGPIVNELGEVVGLVSVNAYGSGVGHCPMPHLTLPVWVCRRIFAVAPTE
jgi:hypothetical protein